MAGSTPLLTLLQITLAITGAVVLRGVTGWPVLACVAVAAVASYPATWLVAAIVGALRRL